MGRALGIYLSATGWMAGCHAETEIEPERSTPARDEIQFDCGELAVPIRLRCGAVSLEEELAISPGPDVVREELKLFPLPCEVDAQDSVGEDLASAIDAWCDDAGSPFAATFRRALHIKSTARSVCAKYSVSSEADLAVSWRSQLKLPSGIFRVAITTKANADRPFCTVELGGEPADPVREGLSRVFLTQVLGPAEQELTVRCDRFSFSSCTSQANQPPRTSDSLDVLIDVTLIE
ncbi:MAG: hypothetical protein IPM79_01625 [Polyangiaceae bacterium]|jgi:hypothetical protein|nr:hypothetical protein [Polyangiaceae bacterium]